MKKIVSYIVMIIIVTFMLTSCNLVTMVTGDYSELANRNFNALITAMENKDKSAVKALFMTFILLLPLTQLYSSSDLVFLFRIHYGQFQSLLFCHVIHILYSLPLHYL